MIENETQYMQAFQFVTECSQRIKQIKDRQSLSISEFTANEVYVELLESEVKEHTLDMQEYDATYCSDRVGEWMPVFSGKRFWPEDVRPEDIDIVDIAHGLAHINRFNGHVHTPYSVAQHCVLVSRLVPDYLKLVALLHDASESYIHDIISPVKGLLANYQWYEDNTMHAIMEKYNLLHLYNDKKAMAIVKKADMVMLSTEARDLTPIGYVRNPKELPLNEKIRECWASGKAKQVFLDEFSKLRMVYGTKQN